MNLEKYQSISNGQVEDDDKNEASFAMLGVAAGEDRYLIPMVEVSEVIPIPKLARISLTQPWFLGVINVRGNLYGITNLGVYLGGNPVPFNLRSRILLTSLDHKIYGGFIVNSMLGVRSLSEFMPAKPAKRKPFESITTQYKDTEGRLWQQLSLSELMHDERFMQIARA